MKDVLAKFIMQLLLPEQKGHRTAVANDLIQTATKDFPKKVRTLKGTEASLSCVQGFLYLVSSLIKVSIFHGTWVDTFWTGRGIWAVPDTGPGIQ